MQAAKAAKKNKRASNDADGADDAADDDEHEADRPKTKKRTRTAAKAKPAAKSKSKPNHETDAEPAVEKPDAPDAAKGGAPGEDLNQDANAQQKLLWKEKDCACVVLKGVKGLVWLSMIRQYCSLVVFVWIKKSMPRITWQQMLSNDMSWNDSVGSNDFPIGLAPPRKSHPQPSKNVAKCEKIAIGGRLVFFLGMPKPVGKLEVGRSRI